MMKLMEDLVGRAERADRSLEALAVDEMGREDRREKIRDLQRALDRMGADGWLDPEELAALRRGAGDLGIDLGLSDDGGRVALTPELGERLRNDLLLARDQTESRGFELKVQTMLSEYQESIGAASKVSKAEHDMYLVAIRNLVA